MRGTTNTTPLKIVAVNEHIEASPLDIKDHMLTALREYLSSFNEPNKTKAFSSRKFGLCNFFSISLSLLESAIEDIRNPHKEKTLARLTVQKNNIKLILSAITKILFKKGLLMLDPLIIFNTSQYFIVWKQLKLLLECKEFDDFEKQLLNIKTKVSNIKKSLNPTKVDEEIINAGLLLPSIDPSRSISKECIHNKRVADLALTLLLNEDRNHLIKLVSQLPDIQSLITVFINLSHAAVFIIKFQLQPLMTMSYIAQRNIMIVFGAIIDEIQRIVTNSPTSVAAEHTEADPLRLLLTCFSLLNELKNRNDAGSDLLPDETYSFINERKESLVKCMHAATQDHSCLTQTLEEIILSIKTELNRLDKHLESEIKKERQSTTGLSQLLATILILSSLSRFLNIPVSPAKNDGQLRLSACLLSYLAEKHRLYADAPTESRWTTPHELIANDTTTPRIDELAELPIITALNGNSYNLWKKTSHDLIQAMGEGLTVVCQSMFNIFAHNDISELSVTFSGMDPSLLICLAEHFMQLMKPSPKFDPPTSFDDYYYARNLSNFLLQVIDSIRNNCSQNKSTSDESNDQCNRVFNICHQVYRDFYSTLDFIQSINKNIGHEIVTIGVNLPGLTSDPT